MLFKVQETLPFFTTEQDERLSKTELCFSQHFHNAQFFWTVRERKRFKHQHTCCKWQGTDGLEWEKEHMLRLLSLCKALLAATVIQVFCFFFSSQRACCEKRVVLNGVCECVSLCWRKFFFSQGLRRDFFRRWACWDFTVKLWCQSFRSFQSF